MQSDSSPSQISGSPIKCYDFFPQSSWDKEKTTDHSEPAEETSRVVLRERNEREHFLNRPSGKRSFDLEETSTVQEYPITKQYTSYLEVPEELEMFDKMLLCTDMNPRRQDESKASSGLHGAKNKLSGGRARDKKKATNKTELVDLSNLLLQCSQSIANNDICAAIYLVKRIRQYASPYGDYIQRLAHYFVNAIEVRLAGTGTSLCKAFCTTKVSFAHILKAYEAYIEACPFYKMTNIFANKSISKLTNGRKKMHIIDFGIMYGIQWPCMIQVLSLLPGERIKLRITGIDLPQPGFHPAERVEETGRLLARYSQRFNLPFEYNAIAKRWENIQIEDLKIDRDEILVVNSIYRLRMVPDETVIPSSPRDTVLNLIKKINPDIFVLGISNGTYSASFFPTRFREALFHFSALFDMFEATLPREDKQRLLFEQEVFGRDAMNVIACEGTSRVDRPETYKKWQARNVRLGFRQLPLYQDIVQEVRALVQLNYHKDFVVEEDRNWMLQGWKGRILFALSLWKSTAQNK